MELSNKMIQDLVNRRHPDYELRKSSLGLYRSHLRRVAALGFKDNIFRYFGRVMPSSRSVWNTLTGLTIPAKS